MLNIDLTGQAAIVTGGAGQLGRTMVRTLAACGADVAIQYRTSSDMAQALQQEVIATGRRAVAVQADVTDQASIKALRATAEAAIGPISIVVNNAVVQYQWKTVLDQDPADYESQFRSCVMQNVLMAKEFVPGMVERGKGGRIIGINTECAMQNFASQSAYVSGKRGMDGVLRVLAREVGLHQITVNQVAPGWTISDSARAEGSEKQDGYSRTVALGRRGTDQELANVVAFLASDLASFITGAYIPVCGGNVMPTI